MACLLDKTSTVKCSHGGNAQPLVANDRVKIKGAPVLTVETRFKILECPNTVGGSPFPCMSGKVTAGATRVKVMGMPVLLDTSQASSTSTGATLTLLGTQQRVKGV